MDGSKSYTICGDALYFAPEIVSCQGYDHAADLWAFGMLVYEMYEGVTMFGAVSEETRLYELISTFSGEVRFTNKSSPAARYVLLYILFVPK
jgi:serine/threonine protein kinase